MEAARRGEDSWTLAAARYRNRMEQKSLGRKLDSMSTNFRCRSTKLMTEIGQLEEQLHQMSPKGGKGIICPKGLTEAEKAEYRQLKRGSFHRSMSLKEFDAKITHYKRDMRMYRRASNATAAITSTKTTTSAANNGGNNNISTTTTTLINNNKNNNNSITITTSPTSATNSVTNNDDTILVKAGIVDLSDHQFCAPIAKHKQTMMEALKRATAAQRETSDVHGDLLRPKSRLAYSDGGAARPRSRKSFGSSSLAGSSRPVSRNSMDSSNIESPSRPRSRKSFGSSSLAGSSRPISRNSLDSSNIESPSRPRSRKSFGNSDIEISPRSISRNSLDSSNTESQSRPKSRNSVATTSKTSFESSGFENPARPKSQKKSFVSSGSEASSRPKSRTSFDDSHLQISPRPASQYAFEGSKFETFSQPQSRKSSDNSLRPGPQNLYSGSVSSRPTSGTNSDSSSQISYVITYSESLNGLDPATDSTTQSSANHNDLQRSVSHPEGQHYPVTLVSQMTVPSNGTIADRTSATRRWSSSAAVAGRMTSSSSSFSTGAVSGGSHAHGGQRMRNIVIRPDYIAARRRSSVSVVANTG